MMCWVLQVLVLEGCTYAPEMVERVHLVLLCMLETVDVDPSVPEVLEVMCLHTDLST